jgi:hypothetical protein
MTKNKTATLNRLDAELLDLEKRADRVGFDIDALPEWVALIALIVAYQFNERHNSPTFRAEYNDKVLEVEWRIFMAECQHRHTTGHWPTH